MKVEIVLKINGNKVDIINSEEFAQQFAITYSFSDLYEPDKVTDSYSKSITLPGTANNNAIFGHIWKIDSDNIEQFNPSQLSDFELYLNNELWQSGTAQLTEITRNNNTYSYKVTLFGTITKVMSMLLNSDIDDESNKLLRSLKYPTKLRHTLNDNMLYMMWNSSYYNGSVYLNEYMNYVPCQNGLYDNFDSSKTLTPAWPWLTGSTPGQDINHPYLTCTPVVYTETNWGSTDGNNHITIASSEDQEFDEYSLQQWRVEYQRPAMKMNKLIEQIVKDASTDASINLDTDFFNSNNPYWYNTYLTLSQYTTDSDEGEVSASIDTYSTKYLNTGTSYTSWDLKFTQTDGNVTIFAPDSSTVIYYGALSGTEKLSIEFMIKVSVLSDTYLPKGQYANEPYYINGFFGGTFGQNFQTNWTRRTWGVSARGNSGAYSSVSTPFSNGAYDSSIHSGIYGYNYIYGTHWSYAYNSWLYESYNGNYPSYPYQYTMINNDVKLTWKSYQPTNDAKYYWKPFKLDLDLSSLNQTGTLTIWVEDIDHRFIAVNDGWTARENKTLPVLVSIKGITVAPSGASSLNNYYPYNYGYTGIGAHISYNTAIRSGDNYGGIYSGIAPSVVTTEDMFDTTTTQGEILLNYTKLCGLLYDTDSSGNITIMSRNKFFTDYEIIDWTDKIDLSKELSIKPIPFNTRYLEMKYNAGDTYYENKYSSEFGLDYGEKKINTGYAFNSQTTQLLDTIFTNTIMASEPRYDYWTEFRYIGKQVPENYFGFIEKGWELPAFSYPCYFTKDGDKKNKADVKYSLLFNAGKKSNAGHITIDSSVMLSEDASVNGGQYCWVYPVTGGGIPAFEHLFRYTGYTPNFTTHYDNYSWDIGYPRISYEGDTTSTYPSGSTVYSRFWEEYISEIYNVKNKILTCYVKLSWIDVLNFSFKNFVTINGVLYHPNKLINVNPLSDDSIQVELIQVQNIDAYTNGQIIEGSTTRSTRARRTQNVIVAETPEVPEELTNYDVIPAAVEPTEDQDEYAIPFGWAVYDSSTDFVHVPSTQRMRVAQRTFALEETEEP
jgi:hypothetical protein